MFANGYLFQIETTYRAHRQGFRISEVPIIFYKPKLGKSKMDSSIITEALLGVLRLRLTHLIERNVGSEPDPSPRVSSSDSLR